MMECSTDQTKHYRTSILAMKGAVRHEERPTGVRCTTCARCSPSAARSVGSLRFCLSDRTTPNSTIQQHHGEIPRCLQTADVTGQAKQAAEAGQFQGAVELFQRAIVLNPSSAQLHEQLAQCLAELAEYTAAEESALQCVTLDPEVDKFPHGHVLQSKRAVPAPCP